MNVGEAELQHLATGVVSVTGVNSMTLIDNRRNRYMTLDVIDLDTATFSTTVTDMARQRVFEVDLHVGYKEALAFAWRWANQLPETFTDEELSCW